MKDLNCVEAWKSNIEVLNEIDFFASFIKNMNTAIRKQEEHEARAANLTDDIKKIKSHPWKFAAKITYWKLIPYGVNLLALGVLAALVYSVIV